MSISSDDNNIKVWDFRNWECLLNFEEVNKYGRLYSACFLNYKNDIYIITSGWDVNSSMPLQVYDLNGKIQKTINNSNDKTFFVNIYYDNSYENLSKYFIITGNNGSVKSYDYINNKIYYKYEDKDNESHFSIIIVNDKNLIKLIESGCDGYIRIWNFHSGKLLSKIFISKNHSLRGICLWNNEYILVGCDDDRIRLINIKKGLIVNEIFGPSDRVITINKIIHPKYGECFVSQGWAKDQIKLFIYD